MFTGIIECLGKVEAIEHDGSNVHFTVSSPVSKELKIDQSIAHNGVCLTVVELGEGTHRVTAIEESLLRSNLGDWKVGDSVNLERCMQMGARLDGHWVQGHVDQIGRVASVEEKDGSWHFGIDFDQGEHITVPKGSITLNGTSLTVVDSKPGYLSVAIIPYTYEYTNFHALKVGDAINMEFDILGKYIQAYVSRQTA